MERYALENLCQNLYIAHKLDRVMRAGAALRGRKMQKKARGWCDLMVDWLVAAEWSGWRGDQGAAAM
jgi:hypothetical protein